MKPLKLGNDSWFLRLFLWSWDIEPDRLDICRLFWGTLVMPVGWLFFCRGRYLPLVGIYLLLSLLYAFTRVWPATIWWLLAALFFVYSTIFEQRRRRVGRNGQPNTGEKTLAAVSRAGWSLTHAAMPIAFLAERVAESKLVRFFWNILTRISGAILNGLIDLVLAVTDSVGTSRPWQFVTILFEVFAEYYHAVKERFCPKVEVVMRKQ